MYYLNVILLSNFESNLFGVFKLIILKNKIMGIFDFLFGKKKTTSEPKAIVKKLNNETIRIAVKEWFEDENRATKKYGFINDWDTSGVTDMKKMWSGLRLI